MFKTGDKVRCVNDSYADRRLRKNIIYEVLCDQTDNKLLSIRKADHGEPLWNWNAARFVAYEPARQCDTNEVSNPCISTEVITTTKRKIKPHSSLKMNGNTVFEQIRQYEDGRISIGGSLYTVKHLKDFAFQVLEIADVLEENAK